VTLPSLKVRAALVAATVATALGGCSLSADHKGAKTAAQAVPDQAVQARQGPVQKTRVKIVEGIGAKGGFDPGTIYQRLAPGVVTVISTSGTSASATAGLGSGFVLDGRGYIATNAHVVRGDPPKLARAATVYVKFADGNRVPATVVGDDLNADVALLKVNPAGLTLTPLPLGSSAGLTVGAPVAAIGSPFGESQSLSVGVISATGRDIESLTAFKIGNAIQTDAAINHGNSGGPLLNSHGRVIGINSQIESTGGGGEGVGFAVPVDAVRRSLDELRRAVVGEDVKALTRVSGVGQKGAQRIILELKDRIGAPGSSGFHRSPVTVPAQDAWRAQVHAGLVGLGWSAKEADQAVEAVAPEADQPAAVTPDVAGLLRAALRSLSKA